MGIFLIMMIGIAIFCFAPLWVPFIINSVAVKAGKVSPHTHLVLDLLMDTTGWRAEYTRRYHQTGVSIVVGYDDNVQELKIDGVSVSLSSADKYALKRAITKLDDAANRQLEHEAVRAFADRANQFWREREQQVADVVPFKRKG